jgi:hypothetical protein
MEAHPTTKPPSPTNFMGWVGFVLAAVSAAFSIFAILTWIYTADMVREMEGGMAFSMNIVPLLV